MPPNRKSAGSIETFGTSECEIRWMCSWGVRRMYGPDGRRACKRLHVPGCTGTGSQPGDA